MSPHQGALSTSSGTGGIASCGPFCFQMLLSGCVSIRRSWVPQPAAEPLPVALSPQEVRLHGEGLMETLAFGGGSQYGTL